MPRLSCYGCGLTDAKSICTITSPFTHLVFDYTPKSIETARGFIAQSESRLTTLDAAIERLQHHRDQLHHATLRHKNYLSPISRLSDDILLLIFQETIEHKAMSWPKVDVWDLAAVCSRWRSLALSNSSLWAKMLVDIPGPSDLPHDDRRALVCCQRALLHLERAEEHPLVCYLDLPAEEGPYRHPFISSTVRHVVSQLHRCSILAMTGLGPSSWDVLPSTHPTFDILRFFEYSNSGEHLRRNPESRMPPFFEATPMLEQLNLRLVRLFLPFPESWKTVTDLDLSTCHVDEVDLAALLSFTENLKKLTLHLLMTPSLLHPETMDEAILFSRPPLPKIAVLPHLETLDIDFHWPSDLEYDNMFHRKIIKHTLPRIRCPNLSVVRISAPGPGIIGGAPIFSARTWDNDIESVQRLILDSDAASSVVSISFTNLTNQDDATTIITLLSKLPCLQSLCIEADAEHGHVNYDSILTALRCPSSAQADSEIPAPADTDLDQPHDKQSTLCPRIRHLGLAYWLLDSTRLHEMIRSRSDNPDVQTLRSFKATHLEFTNDVPPDGHLGWWLKR